MAKQEDKGDVEEHGKWERSGGSRVIEAKGLRGTEKKKGHRIGNHTLEGRKYLGQCGGFYERVKNRGGGVT